MNELSLFTGAGGGIYGSKLLGHKVIGYVEFNEYCQKVIRQRIEDGVFDKAPIFSDVREFANIAQEYRGFADVVTAGFPCPSFSVAGKRKGEDDERNMWPQTIDIVRKIRPKIFYGENVPGLLSASKQYCTSCGESEWVLEKEEESIICGNCESPMDKAATRPFFYFGSILRDISESGYDARWTVLGADDCGYGGKHRRKRLWIKCRRRDAANAND